jgi:pyrroloquinoline quinone (PQQ) biosynthesis protein C
MSTYERIVEATEEEYRTFIENNELLKAVAAGQMTPKHYIAYLRETYHLVRHTPRMLALGGARLQDDRRQLRNWFFEQTIEENGHDLFCIKDIEHLGANPKEIVNTQPGPGAWGLVTQNYFMATYGNPVGILGVATATEGLGADFGTRFADLMTQQYALPSNTSTFLRSHGGFDAKHLEEAVSALELITPDEVDYVIQARRMTFRYYGQLFADVSSAATAANAAVQKLAA